MEPRLSVVLLTWNEEKNIQRCLQALGRQTDDRFEIVLVDAASTDATVAIATAAAEKMPVNLHVEASPHRLPIGAARNLGVRLARAPAVAFLSADTEARADWVQRALSGLEQADMVFGRQIHAPDAWTPAAAVRGLRYRFPSGSTAQPLRFASNVAGAFSKELLERFPFDEHADAAEDLLLARRAAQVGARARYDPDLVVLHHDVQTFREEMRKNVREGRAWGRHAIELGDLPALRAWIAVLGAGILLAARRPGLGVAAVAATLWAPALHRAVRRRRDMPALAIAAGVAASPPFDVAFGIQYMRGRRDAEVAA